MKQKPVSTHPSVSHRGGCVGCTCLTRSATPIVSNVCSCGETVIHWGLFADAWTTLAWALQILPGWLVCLLHGVQHSRVVICSACIWREVQWYEQLIDVSSAMSIVANFPPRSSFSIWCGDAVRELSSSGVLRSPHTVPWLRTAEMLRVAYSTFSRRIVCGLVKWKEYPLTRTHTHTHGCLYSRSIRKHLSMWYKGVIMDEVGSQGWYTYRTNSLVYVPWKSATVTLHSALSYIIFLLAHIAMLLWNTLLRLEYHKLWWCIVVLFAGAVFCQPVTVTTWQLPLQCTHLSVLFLHLAQTSLCFLLVVMVSTSWTNCVAALCCPPPSTFNHPLHQK